MPLVLFNAVNLARLNLRFVYVIISSKGVEDRRSYLHSREETDVCVDGSLVDDVFVDVLKAVVSDAA